MTAISKSARVTLYGLFMLCVAAFLYLAIEGYKALAAGKEEKRGHAHTDGKPRA